MSRLTATCFGSADRFVPEQRPPAGPHGPGGDARARPRLRPLPGPRGLVQRLQTPGLLRGEWGGAGAAGGAGVAGAFLCSTA